MSDVAVACCQLAPRVGECEATRARARAAVLEAVHSGAQIVVLPELADSGYVFADIDEARACAERIDGACARSSARFTCGTASRCSLSRGTSAHRWSRPRTAGSGR